MIPPRPSSRSRWRWAAAFIAITASLQAADFPPRELLPELSPGAGATAGSPAAETSPPKPPYAIERLHSTILNEERAVLIRLPRHYQRDTSTRYPVLFKLDGGSGLERYDATIDILSCTDAIPDLIIVAIPNARGRRNRDMTPARLHQGFDVTGKMGTGERGEGDRFLEFMEKELIPHLEQRYRMAAPRILAGHSRSALLVLESLLSKPDLFGARFIFSAPLQRDEQCMIAATRAFLAHHPEHRSFVYFNWGENENDGMNRSHAAMRDLLSAAAPDGLRWTIERARGADHQQTPVLALPAALFDYFSHDEGGLPDIRGPASTQSGRLSSARPPRTE